MADIGHDRSVLEIVPREKVIFESELIYGGNNVVSLLTVEPDFELAVFFIYHVSRDLQLELESKEGTKITTIDEEEMSAAKRNDAPQVRMISYILYLPYLHIHRRMFPKQKTDTIINLSAAN